QRAPARSKKDTEEKIDPRLLAILSAHQEHETYAARVREERKASAAAADVQRQVDDSQPNAQPTGRRRSRASFDYVETRTLLPPNEEIGHAAPPKMPPADTIQPAPLPAEPEPDEDDEETSSLPPTFTQQTLPENHQPAAVESAEPPLVQRTVQPPN